MAQNPSNSVFDDVPEANSAPDAGTRLVARIVLDDVDRSTLDPGNSPVGTSANSHLLINELDRIVTQHLNQKRARECKESGD